MARLFFVSVIMFVAPLFSQEPLNGKVASLIDRLNAREFDARALDELIDIGPSATSPLIAVLAATDRERRTKQRVARALRAMAPLPTAEVSRLLNAAGECLDAENLRLIVSVLSASVPGRVHEEEVKDLVSRSIKSKHRELEFETVRFGIRFFAAHRAEEDQHKLLEMLSSANPVERGFAVERLGELRRADQHVLDALVRLTNEASQPKIAYLACFTSCAIKSEALGSAVREAAAIASARLRPDSPLAINGLRLLLERADRPRERIMAVVAIADHGELAADTIPSLLAALDDPDDRLVGNAITTLGSIGGRDGRVVRRLEAFAAGSSSDLRMRATTALRRLGNEGAGR